MRPGRRLTRRSLLSLASLGVMAAFRPWTATAAPQLKVTAVELLPVRATYRTVWLLVRLRTDAGLTGIGEASDAFGFANTTKEDATRMEAELKAFASFTIGRSPLEIAAYRQQGWPRALAGGLVSATAFSAVEQALWDLAGQALDVPNYALFGGRLRSSLPVYANINRATSPRTPDGFAAAARAAVRDGFRALKAAPFDGFPPPGSSPAAIEAAVEAGIAALEAMRAAVGTDVDIMVDCHSFFDVALAERVATRLEPVRLRWYEEPVAPEKLDETRAIRQRITQPMAGGEVLFGVAGFAGLSRDRTVDVIMPDVKHCGGLLELTRIAAVADEHGVAVAPHNPSGPVSTAASVQVCAVIPNFSLIELQWGEVPWRGELVTPPERFERGTITVPDRPGLGIALNEALVRKYLM